MTKRNAPTSDAGLDLPENHRVRDLQQRIGGRIKLALAGRSSGQCAAHDARRNACLPGVLDRFAERGGSGLMIQRRPDDPVGVDGDHDVGEVVQIGRRAHLDHGPRRGRPTRIRRITTRIASSRARRRDEGRARLTRQLQRRMSRSGAGKPAKR